MSETRENVIGGANPHETCGDDCTMHRGADSSVSRRQILGGVGATAAMMAGSGALAQNAKTSVKLDPDEGEVKVNLTYRALVRREAGKRAKIERIKIARIKGRQVLTRVVASHLCYSDCSSVLGGRFDDRGPWPASGDEAKKPPPRIEICGHQGIGIVEMVGPQVRRVKPGDRVFIAVTAHCGECYNCIRQRADWCSANLLNPPIIGTLEDGTPVAQEAGGGIGGLGEYMVNYEERLVPIFSSLSNEELAMFGCSGSTGLGSTCTLRPIESGSRVVIFGAGPVGLSAVQGARIQGATRIIAIDPIAARRQMAVRFGATDVIDPNQHGDNLVRYVRSMLLTGTDRVFAGGRPRPEQDALDPAGFGQNGPDYVIEAVGRQWAAPKVEQSLDPTGLTALRQAWELTPPTGVCTNLGVNFLQTDKISLPAEIFTVGGKTIYSMQNGGTQSKRDLPRFVRLIEEKKFDVKSMISNVYKFDDIFKGYQEVLDRTAIGNVITYG